MNELEDRLSDLLARAADATDVRDDLDTVISGGPPALSRVADDGRPRHLRVRAASLVAAVAVPVLLLTAVLVTRGAEPDAAARAEHPGATRFPVVDDLPDGVEGDLYGSYAVPGDGNPTRTVSALIARRDGDGLDDLIQVFAIDQPADRSFDGGTRTTVDGRPATYHPWPLAPNEGGTLVLDGTPSVGVSGLADLETLRTIAAGVAVSGDASTFTFAVHDLPAGLEVIVAPGAEQVLVAQPNVALSEGSHVLAIGAHTEIRDPRMIATMVDRLDPVTIGSATGWIGESINGVVVAWEPEPGVIVSVDGNIRPEVAVEVARRVHLVDEATWRRIYDVTDDPTGQQRRAPLWCSPGRAKMLSGARPGPWPWSGVWWVGQDGGVRPGKTPSAL